MNTELKEAKRTIRTFMRAQYTDERLAMLLAHLQDNKFTFLSCCCFIGIVTADHPLKSASGFGTYTHFARALLLPSGQDTEGAVYTLGDVCNPCSADRDQLRTRRLIPIIKLEMRRREHLRQSSSECVGAAELSQQESVSVS